MYYYRNIQYIYIEGFAKEGSILLMIPKSVFIRLKLTYNVLRKIHNFFVVIITYSQTGLSIPSNAK